MLIEDILGQLYKEREEFVIAFDTDYNIKWQSADDYPLSFAGRGISDIIGTVPNAGEYLYENAYEKYSYRISVIENEGEKLFVAEFSIKDEFERALDNSYVKKILRTEDALIRESVFDISSNLNMLFDDMDEFNLRSDVVFINNAMVRCYDMLRSTSLAMDYYSIEMSDVVSLTALAEDFADEIAEIARRSPLRVECDIERGISVIGTKQGVVACLSMMLLYELRANRGCYGFFLSVRKNDNCALIQLVPNSSLGFDNPESLRKMRDENPEGVFGIPEISYLRLFCRKIGGNVMEQTHTDGCAITIRLPLADDLPDTVFKSCERRYMPHERYSKTRILLGERCYFEHF